MKRTRVQSCGKALGTREIYYMLMRLGWIAKKKDGKHLTSREFSLFMRDMGQVVINTIIAGENYELPHHLGLLRLTKSKRRYYTDKDGKTRITNGINWIATKKLWAENEEAKKEKIFVMFDSEWLYKIQYNKKKAKFKNKLFTFIRISSPLKSQVAKAIKEGRAVAMECKYRLKN